MTKDSIFVDVHWNVKRLIRSLNLATMLSMAVLTTEARAASILIAPDDSHSFAIYWSLLVGTTDLTALGDFNVDVTDAYADFLITLTNNTTLVSERIHSIGFNTDPNATSLTNALSGTYFQNFRLNQNFPSFQRIDVCAWGTQNCSGGGQRSNLPGGGTSDTFGFRLNGDFSDGLLLDNFAIKFQGDLGSFEFNDTPPAPPPPVIPEPASLVLLATGLAISARSLRRGPTN